MIELETLVDTPAFAVAYDKVNHYLYVTWEGPHDAVSSHENCNIILQYARLKKVQRILNDSSLVLDGWNEVTAWLGREFFPELACEGVQVVAWVRAHDWPARLIIDKTLQLVTRPVVDAFETTYEAYAWLQAIPKQVS